MDKVYYFGCWSESGHYLWDHCGRRISQTNSDLPRDFPMQVNALDGGLIPERSRSGNGEAYLAHVNGWTIISFVDCSVDKRPGSHSAFVLRGEKPFETALAEAREWFPEIFARFTFEVVLAPELKQ